jgi:dTDP-glucose pyrophosphorylase
MGYITAEQLQKLAGRMRKNGYGQYLLGVLQEQVF